MSAKRNVAQDRRAASLQLRPRPKQNNFYSKGFFIESALSDIEITEHQRKIMCADASHTGRMNPL